MLQAVENDALVSILTFTVVKISKSIIRNQDCWVASFHAEHLKYIKKIALQIFQPQQMDINYIFP